MVGPADRNQRPEGERMIVEAEGREEEADRAVAGSCDCRVRLTYLGIIKMGDRKES